MVVEFRTTVSPEARDTIESAVSTQRTLEDVIRWGLAQRPPLLIECVVVQDEYTHDVVIAHPTGVFLAYDTT